MNSDTATQTVRSGTYRLFSYDELHPNPLNPRRLFDKEPLNVLESSIRANGILVPLTVYQERNGKFYILDGERRWKCARQIEKDPMAPQRVEIPANIVNPPDKVANILWMFNIHNLREQWELMPAALSLKVVMEELKETDDQKLAQLTHMSLPNVRRCKILLSYDKKYQNLMLAPDSGERVKSNFFIELAPVLDLYNSLPKRCRAGKSFGELVDLFLDKYRRGKIPSVIHFRRILEAHDHLKEGDRFDLFENAAQTFVTDKSATIRNLFDPLVAEDKSAANAEQLCKTFLGKLKRLKVEHTTTRRASLRRQLEGVKKYIDALLVSLEG